MMIPTPSIIRSLCSTNEIEFSRQIHYDSSHLKIFFSSEFIPRFPHLYLFFLDKLKIALSMQRAISSQSQSSGQNQGKNKRVCLEASLISILYLDHLFLQISIYECLFLAVLVSSCSLLFCSVLIRPVPFFFPFT